MIFDDNWPAILTMSMVSVRNNHRNPPGFIPLSQSEKSWSNQKFSNGKAVIQNQGKSIPVAKKIMDRFRQKEDLSVIHMRMAIGGK
jgi:hypothetical protein